MTQTCNETAKLSDDRTLMCALSAGHDGPVHEDEHGEQWGDQRLAQSLPELPAA